MKNNKVINFLKRKDVLASLCFCLVAALAITGIVIMQNAGNDNANQQQIADQDNNDDDMTAYLTETLGETEAVETEDEVANANSNQVLTQEEVDEILANNNDMDAPETEYESDMSIPSEASADNAEDAAEVSLNFTDADMLSWPVLGNVIMDYSMDKSIYFTTLNQYKYNPALIIGAEVNTQVVAAASGQVLSIDVSEETGTTIVMDLGNGFTATYGQLKEVPLAEGDMVTEGAVVGYVSEPTKYYSVEGSNLYFKLMLNDTPVDPMLYLPQE